MNPHCECPLAGWCKRHKMNKGPEQHKRCQGVSGTADCGLAYWKAWEQGRAGATAPLVPVLEPETFCSKIVAKSRIGTTLSAIIKREAGIEIPCEQCREAIASLDRMDVKEAMSVRERMVDDIVSRAPQQANVWQSILIGVDSLLHTGVLKSKVESWFDEAVATGAQPQTEPVKKKLHRGVRRAGGSRLQHSPEQQALCEAALSAPKPEPDPWLNKPVFHFGAHLWPTVIDGVHPWLWHIDRWNELAEQINGKAIVCVAIGDGTVDAGEVRSLLSDKIEMVVLKNEPDGENQSFRKLQELIPRGPDDVLLYCHGKGVRPHTHNSEAVRIWSEMMYETVVFNLDGIRQRLAEGYKAFGSFRTFGSQPLDAKHKWHYSGTFYAVRAKHLGRPVKRGYGGVEVWPGEHFRPEECWNEFGDNRPLKAQYDYRFMYPRTVDDSMQWEVDRLGGPRCEQHKRELDWFLQFLEAKDRILVIGSKHGGLEHQIRKNFPDSHIVACDIAPQRDNRECVIVGDSSSPDVQQQCRNLGPFDVVFIDGDHSYEGVRKDWEFAQSLSPRLVAFHDIAVAIKHRNEGCEVDRLWAAICQTHHTAEKIVGCGWGGIGVVFTDCCSNERVSDCCAAEPSGV